MVLLVVAGKPDRSTPSNTIELDDGCLNVNLMSRRDDDEARNGPGARAHMLSSALLGGRLPEPSCEEWRRPNTNNHLGLGRI
ncbi:hypothetical protein EVAR_26766_1 [Eumeta japonica]|uniref:Uncharacterized protein n=1 Tax=Eumeta variegata TaxID=151549 RepID=A0A4C1XBT0_EUMVA|nr:hypothetical protein EVAR_26766_1 [Eumeta japonica]